MSKKRIAPRPAPRSKAPVVTSEENEQDFNIASGSSPLLKEEELEDVTNKECGSHLENGEDQDDLIIDDLNLELFDGGASIGSSNYEEQNDDEEEEFDETIIEKILTKHQSRSFADLLNDGLEELVEGDTEMEACSKSEGKVVVEGFSLEMNKEDDTSLKTEQLAPKCDLNQIKLKSANLTEGRKRIHQVESVLNFSSFSREGNQEELGRFSSNSLCSEVDMQFVNKAAKMNRWRNMEALNHSSVDFSSVEEDDSSNWVVGSESDNEVGEASEAAREKEDPNFVKRADVQQIEENLNDVTNKSFGLQKKLEDYEIVKGDGVCSVLPSPPPSLEYMGPADGVAQEEKGDGMHEDLEWEYKLPAPPTGFEDEDERTAEEVKEDTWLVESASIPSTFSSSHQKVWVGEGERSNHLPNFRMGTYKAPSSEGWEDPRETNNDKHLEKRSGSMFAMLNSENIEREADREVDKNYLETWASISTRSSVTSAPSSSVHTFKPTAHTNSGYKDGVRGEKNGLAKNGSYVVRVSSFGGKSSMNLKRSLSSTSSIFSRHNGINGKDAAEKLDKESVESLTLRSNNGNEIRALSNASRTVSLHDLAVNSAEEECKVAVSMVNGYHKENTTPKIVSSMWKKHQEDGGDPPGKYPPPVSHNLRKTSSELSISQASVVNGWKGVDDEDQKVAKLQQQFLHWHEQMLQNKSALDGSVSLKSLQVLRGVLPQLKKSLSSDLADKAAVQKSPAKRKESDQGRTDSSEMIETNRDEGDILNSLSTTTEQKLYKETSDIFHFHPHKM
ncbi:hypothetical protein J437_LFUL011702 [Ladona fulva]|uniref:Uncharacterized protein n=1 Tax=Ladona fulva TaxID=123851 RepID=A0A8K0KPI7_LADFU|nr:hypothetical protein J437_LFUL011702 [Ladona fulva]